MTGRSTLSRTVRSRLSLIPPAGGEGFSRPAPQFGFSRPKVSPTTDLSPRRDLGIAQPCCQLSEYPLRFVLAQVEGKYGLREKPQAQGQHCHENRQCRLKTIAFRRRNRQQFRPSG